MATATHYRHLFTPSISTKRKHQRLQVLPLLFPITRSTTPTTSATILTISARLEMTFTAPGMTYAAAEMTYIIKMIIRNAGLWALRIRVNTMMMITVSCGLPQPDSLQPVLQMDARTSHEPQSGLTHAAEVIVAVSGQIVGLQVELISGLAP